MSGRHARGFILSSFVLVVQPLKLEEHGVVELTKRIMDIADAYDEVLKLSTSPPRPGAGSSSTQPLGSTPAMGVGFSQSE